MFSVELIREIEQNRVRLTDTLLLFVKTDTILFAFNEECEDCFIRFVSVANEVLNTAFILTRGIEIAEVNQEQDKMVRVYLEGLSVQKFALVYLAAIKVRSVLLGVLFAEGQINSDEVLNTAFFEELWQQKKWGDMAEIKERHNTIKNELLKLENLRDAKSLS